jgi:hypothetical protein
MTRYLKVVLTLAALAVSVGTVRAQAATPPLPGSPIPMCSDPGWSCSVDRNCCSGTCNKGLCQ